MKKKVTYIISNIDKAVSFEWICDELNKVKFELSFILLNPGYSLLEDFLNNKKIPFIRINYSGKMAIPKSIFRVFLFLKKNKIDIIHTHLFDANLIGLIAGKIAGVRQRIYTRHHSTYHHIFYPSSVKFDKLCNILSTEIIAISKNVENVLLRENVDPKKIRIIHHGFKISEFENIESARIQFLKEKYNPENKRPVIGVIARYTYWKGIQNIIPAFKEILKEFPDALLILANAQGDYLNDLQKLLKELPHGSFTEIKFEPDNLALYKLFDVFVHVPVDAHSEAFGQVYIESLVSGIPSVFTISGIAEEFIKDQKNALVVPYNSPSMIYNSILKILGGRFNFHNEDELKKIKQNFSLETMIKKLEALYLESDKNKSL